MVTHGMAWSSMGRRRCARASAARASSCLRLVECDARRRHVCERARRVVAEAGLVDDRQCRQPLVAPPRPSLPAWRRGARAVPVPGRPPRPSPLQGPSRRSQSGSSVARSVAPSSACATPRPRSATGTHSLSGGADSAPDRRRRAPARHRSASCAPAGSRPRARSWSCHRRAGSSRLPRRRERAIARHLQAGPSARGPRLQRRRARGSAASRRRRTSRATPPRSRSGRRSGAAAQGRRPSRRPCPSHRPRARRRPRPPGSRWQCTSPSPAC